MKSVTVAGWSVVLPAFLILLAAVPYSLMTTWASKSWVPLVYVLPGMLLSAYMSHCFVKGNCNMMAWVNAILVIVNVALVMWIMSLRDQAEKNIM